MRFREADAADAPAIAALHAESWRAHYRGAYRDAYLDGDVFEDRLRVWEERLSTPARNQFVVLSEEEDALIGFACAYGAQDEVWGSLLDNIHVRPERQRRGRGGEFSEPPGGGQIHGRRYAWKTVPILPRRDGAD